MLAGLLYPTGGMAEVVGYTPSERQRGYLQQITLVMGQRNQMMWDIPVIDSFERNRALFFGISLVTAAVIIYSFWAVLATLAFWFIRIENITQVFWAMYVAGRWPVTIYPDWLKWTLTILVPIAFAVTVPAQAVSGRLDGSTLAGAILLALLIFSRWFWKVGVKFYAGASA